MNSIDILIVDDSPAFINLAKLMINKTGIICKIHEASNGKRALDYLSQAEQCPDLILLDINMPVMDGFDFLEDYKLASNCHPLTSIYMLTSSAQEIDKAKAHSYGIVKGYFEKPLTKENILQIISELKKSI